MTNNTLQETPEFFELRRQAEQWVDDAAASLLAHQPRLAAALVALPVRVVRDERLHTAMTDGEAIYVNPHFMQTLTPAERVFVYAHEVWHVLLEHHGRRADRWMPLWNLACDHEINQLLRDADLTMPESAYVFDRVMEHHQTTVAELVYELLVMMMGGEEAESRDRAVAMRRTLGGRLARSLPPWVVNELAQRTRSRTRQRGRVPVTELVSDAMDGLSGCPAPEVEPAAAGVPEFVPDFVRAVAGCRDPLYPSERWSPRASERLRELARTMDNPLRSTSLNSSRWDGVWSRAVSASGGAQLRWQDLLANHLQGWSQRRGVDWSRPSRRFAHLGVHLPSLVHAPVFRLGVVVDTSGSMEPVWESVAAELLGLWRASSGWQVRLLQCDDRVRFDGWLSGASELANALPVVSEGAQRTLTAGSASGVPMLEFHGGGGTSFVPALERLRHEPLDGVVVLTDGHGTYPSDPPSFPVVWVMSSAKRPPFGAVVRWRVDG